MAKKYEVVVPIAGHAVWSGEAGSEKDAIEKALSNITKKDIESWTVLKEFNSGNVCYCPSPWNAEAFCVEEEG